MCCFAKPVIDVGKTGIFGRLSGEGTQFLVYEMEYESRVPNAMILPLPTAKNATEESVNFIDLSNYKDIFKDLNRAFPAIAPPPSKNATRGALDSAMASKTLEVQEVGDFVASVVPTVNDFERLDQQFVIPKKTWEKIPRYEDYSFAVFQLKELKGKPHPMAFEFKTRFEDKIFFPTVHIHDGEVHDREHFDHVLYCQHAAYDGMVGDYKLKKELATGLIRSKSTANAYLNVGKTAEILRPDLLIHKQDLRGTLPNKDILLSAKGDPTKISRSLIGGANSFSNLLGMAGLVTATAAVGLPLAWIVNRRNKMKNQAK